MASVAPTTWPPLMPPPAIHIVKPRLWWSRPLPDSASGERPNSPPQRTSVLSSSPRRFRSLSRPATGLSVSAALRRWFSSMSLWASHCRLPGPPPETTQTNRTPCSTSLPRQQAAPAVVVRRLGADAVEVERLLRLARQVEDLGRLGLHLERQVVGVDPGGELLVGRVERRLVQLADQLQASRRRRSGVTPGGQVEVEHGPVAGPEHRRLVDRRQEAVACTSAGPPRAPLRVGHHHVGRQRLALRAQAVEDPRAHAREARARPGR